MDQRISVGLNETRVSNSIFDGNSQYLSRTNAHTASSTHIRHKYVTSHIPKEATIQKKEKNEINKPIGLPKSRTLRSKPNLDKSFRNDRMRQLAKGTDEINL